MTSFEWKDGDDWKKYDDNTNTVLRDAYLKNPLGSVTITQNGTEYIVDFNSWRQSRKSDPSRTRRVRKFDPVKAKPFPSAPTPKSPSSAPPTQSKKQADNSSSSDEAEIKPDGDMKKYPKYKSSPQMGVKGDTLLYKSPNSVTYLANFKDLQTGDWLLLAPSQQMLEFNGKDWVFRSSPTATLITPPQTVAPAMPSQPAPPQSQAPPPQSKPPPFKSGVFKSGALPSTASSTPNDDTDSDAEDETSKQQHTKPKPIASSSFVSGKITEWLPAESLQQPPTNHQTQHQTLQHNMVNTGTATPHIVGHSPAVASAAPGNYVNPAMTYNVAYMQNAMQSAPMQTQYATNTGAWAGTTPINNTTTANIVGGGGAFVHAASVLPPTTNATTLNQQFQAINIKDDNINHINAVSNDSNDSKSAQPTPPLSQPPQQQSVLQFQPPTQQQSVLQFQPPTQQQPQPTQQQSVLQFQPLQQQQSTLQFATTQQPPTQPLRQTFQFSPVTAVPFPVQQQVSSAYQTQPTSLPTQQQSTLQFNPLQMQYTQPTVDINNAATGPTPVVNMQPPAFTTDPNVNMAFTQLQQVGVVASAPPPSMQIGNKFTPVLHFTSESFNQPLHQPPATNPLPTHSIAPFHPNKQ